MTGFATNRSMSPAKRRAALVRKYAADRAAAGEPLTAEAVAALNRGTLTEAVAASAAWYRSVRFAAMTAPVAAGRRETDPCERGTVGCSVDHVRADRGTACATW
jgi:hypothetical protein